MNLNNFSLRRKLSSIPIIFIFLMLLSTCITVISISNQKGDAPALNIAGRQRMLSQKMTKELFMALSSKVGAQADYSAISKTSALFETSLQGLINGNKDLNLNPANDKTLLKTA
jgi:methyl-accepting chemotaxis protein